MIQAGLVHDSWPPLIHFFVVADGGLIVATPDLMSQRDTVLRARVFDANGELKGITTFPPRTFPVFIRGDRAVAISSDYNDVQEVVVLRVRRR
jgi:hypothetical protein